LSELQVIFPIVFEEQKICSVQYSLNPATNVQWNEVRAFLGFATHYIREVARIVGVPLPYLLVPLGGSSRAVCRLSEQKFQLIADFAPQSVKAGQAYEGVLIACARHILETLLMTVEITGAPGHILIALRMLTQIGEENLRTLIPAQCE
jgi:hypothetical protein